MTIEFWQTQWFKILGFFIIALVISTYLLGFLVQIIYFSKNLGAGPINGIKDALEDIGDMRWV